MSRLKNMIIILLIGLLSVIIVGCSTPEATDEPTDEPEPTESMDGDDDSTDAPEPTEGEEPTEEEMSDDEPVSIRVMSWSQEQSDFYAEAEAAFEEEHPNIDVEFETLAQDAYREALPLMFQSDDAPDVFFWIGANRVQTMAELDGQGWIAPMTPQDAADDGWFDRWPEGQFVEGVNMQGDDVYSFPFNDNKIWGAGYMYMNDELFEAAGLDADADAPETWDDLREVCETIRDGGEGPYCLAIPLDGTDFQRTWYPISGTIMSDSFFDLQTGRYAIDDPRMLEAFNFIQGLYADDYVVPGVNDKGFARAAVANGQAAIYFGGAWMPSVFQDSYEFDNFSVAAPPYPTGDDRGALLQTYSENKWWLSSQSEHPEAASQFIEWMTRPDGFFATTYLENGFGTLAYSDNAAYITDPLFLEVVEVATTSNPDMRVLAPEPLVACPDLSQSEAIIEAENIRRNWEYEEMVAALTGGSDFADIAADIAAEKNRVFIETLEAEAESGLDVSQSCYTFPNWEFGTPFDTSLYNNE